MDKPRPKVLILDDSAIVRDLLAETLTNNGYDVVGVESPFEFPIAMRRERPDLVLMDVGMPGLGGDKVVQFARRGGHGQCPILLFSDRPEIELARLAASCGADGFIRKTAEPDALLQKLAELLRR